MIRARQSLQAETVTIRPLVGAGSLARRLPVAEPQDIDAALAYAAELAREGTADLPLETKA